MSRSLASSIVVALISGMCGCQCCRLTERYQDKIDCIADHTLTLDRLYHPEHDLTRIGYPDWCQSRLNRWCYGDCCRDCRVPPAYDPMPIYYPWMDAETGGVQPGEIPALPPIDPIAPSNDIGPSLSPSPEEAAEPKIIPDPQGLEVGPSRLPPLENPLPTPPENLPPPSLNQGLPVPGARFTPPHARRDPLVQPAGFESAGFTPVKRKQPEVQPASHEEVAPPPAKQVAKPAAKPAPAGQNPVAAEQKAAPPAQPPRAAGPRFLPAGLTPPRTKAATP